MERYRDRLSRGELAGGESSQSNPASTTGHPRVVTRHGSLVRPKLGEGAPRPNFGRSDLDEFFWPLCVRLDLALALADRSCGSPKAVDVVER